MKKLLLVFLVIFIVIFVIPVLGLLTLRLQNTGVRTDMMTLRNAKTVGEATDSFYGATEPMMGKVSPMMPPVYDQGFTQVEDRSIVKTAFLSLVATDTRVMVEQITTKMKQFNGVVTQANIYETEFEQGAVNADMTLRVPVDQLESALNEIRALAVKVTSENVSAYDQTEQKVDLDAQLRNLRATEAQFLNIMKQAETVEDTLRVQQELSQIRSQIERLEAQLQSLEGAAAMSTIQVSISTEESELPIVDPDQSSILDEIKTSLREAVTLYRELFVAGIRMFILGLPILVIGGVLYFISKRKKS